MSDLGIWGLKFDIGLFLQDSFIISQVFCPLCLIATLGQAQSGTKKIRVQWHFYLPFSYALAAP